jgi:hypothetical protein
MTSAWRRIETAPRDRDILLHVEWEPLTVVGFWSPALECWCVRWDESTMFGFEPVTHWCEILEVPPHE